MDIRFCRYADQIAKEQNLSRAALKLYVTQSALSQQLDKMEAQMGARLFERQKNRMVPTEAGEIFLEAAREIIRTQEGAYERIATMSRLYSERISLAVSRQTGALLCARILPPFKEACPNVKIDIHEADTNEAKREILDGSVNLALLGDSGEPHALIEQAPLYSEEIMLVLPRNHPLAASVSPEGANLSLFRDEDFILSRPGTHFRRMTDRIFAQRGIIPHSYCELNNFYAVKNLVASGFGVAFLHRSLASGLDDVVALSLDPPFRYPFYIAHHKALTTTEPMRRLVAISQEVCGEL